MNPTSHPKGPTSDTYTLINIVLVVAVLFVLVGNGFYTFKMEKTLETAKQEKQTAEITTEGQANLERFFNDNPEMSMIINEALPDQNGIIKMIEAVESLEEGLKLTKSFTFTSPVPIVENNQYFLPFTIRVNATGIQLITFLRQFEKLPYLTKITSLNAKTPGGLGGVYEITVTGKVYVQDAFKN
jgi:Tfp pilus assembly protein PilO